MTAAASAAPYAKNLHLAPGAFVALANLRYKMPLIIIIIITTPIPHHSVFSGRMLFLTTKQSPIYNT